jgi:hypothetical protein
MAKTLSELKRERAEQAERRAQADRPKATWLSLKSGESVRLRFMQELDDAAENYNEERGLGALLVVHSTKYVPGSASRTALCTIESEGNCYGCERYAVRDEDSKTWRPYTSVYVNVLVDSGNGELKSMVLNKKANTNIVDTLIEWAEDADSVTNVVWKYARQGDGKETKYSLMTPPKATDESTLAKFPIDEFPLFDVANIVPNVAYAEQPKYYGYEATTPVSTSSATTEKVDAEDIW